MYNEAANGHIKVITYAPEEAKGVYRLSLLLGVVPSEIIRIVIFTNHENKDEGLSN